MGYVTADDQPGDTRVPEFAKGGLVLGPDGEDSVLAWIDPRCEQIFTAEQVRRSTAEVGET